MPPTKRQRLAKQDRVSEETPTPTTVVSLEDPSNVEKGLLKFPIELRDKVLYHFQGVNVYTETPQYNPILHVEYLEWTDVLRALSQVCVAYRRVFLSSLWESLTACHASRSGQETLFYMHAGTTLDRKCDGLMSNPGLVDYVRHAHVVVTRYKSATIIPKFASLLTRLPNLHTLHILHAHTQISKALKEGFSGKCLPQIRNVVVPGYCHEILKCCPGIKSVWCIREDGRKLISVIAKDCKEVEELRGFRPDESMIKKIVKGIPNLRVYEIIDGFENTFLKVIESFAKLNTVIIVPRRLDLPVSEATIKMCAVALKSLPPTTDKRRIFISHECASRPMEYCRQLTGNLTEVDLSSLV